jgi:hypothetical protein
MGDGEIGWRLAYRAIALGWARFWQVWFLI